MKIFTFLLIIITIFIVNIGLYSVSESYRGFLKSFKNDGAVTIVDDDYILEDDGEDVSLEIDLEKPVVLLSEPEYQEGEIATIKQEIPEQKTLEMSEYEKEILFLFKEYNFTKLLSHSSLFGLTDEYPQEYFEYYSPEVTLIMFSNDVYDNVRETLGVIGDLENFSLNEIDNFGDESFYINVDEDFDDGNVRIVFTKNGKVFGLKISKNQYNNVKGILEEL